MFEELPAEALSELSDPWRRLQRASSPDNLFVTSVWIRRWLVAFGQAEHRLFVERDGDELLAATVMRRRGDELLPLGSHSYYPEILCRPGHSLRSFLGFVAATGVRRVRATVRHDGEGRRALERALAGSFEVVPIDENVFHVVDCRAPCEGYLATRSGRVRRNLARKNRKLDAAFDEVELIRSHEKGDELMAQISDVDAASWKAREGTAMVSDDAELAFYRDLTGIDEDGVRGRSYVLVADGCPRAFVTGVDHRGCYYALKTSYRTEDARLAPGQVLFLRVVGDLCETAAVERLELLGKDARWKRELASETIVMADLELEASSLGAKARRLAHGEVKPRVRSTVAAARSAVKERPRLAEALTKVQKAQQELGRWLEDDGS